MDSNDLLVYNKLPNVFVGQTPTSEYHLSYGLGMIWVDLSWEILL